MMARNFQTAVLHLPMQFSAKENVFPCAITEISEIEDLSMEGITQEIDCVVHLPVRALKDVTFSVGDRGSVGSRNLRVDKTVTTPDGVELRLFCKDISK